MVSKKILGLAIAAAFSSQAFAALDLNTPAATSNKVVFAKEAFVTGAAVVGNDNGTYYKVGGANNAVLDITGTYGTGIQNTQKRFVRIDLSNAIFTTLSGLASTTVPVAPSTGAGAGALVQGGQNKDTYAILEVTATAAIAQTDGISINVDELAINVNAAAGVTVSVYETLTAAVNQTAGTVLNTKSLTGVFTAGSGLKVTNTPNTLTANVSADFKKFVGTAPADTEGSIGTFGVTFDNTVLLPSTVAVAALNELIAPATSKVSFLGDFSVGAWTYTAVSPGGTAFTYTTTGKVATVGVDLGTAFSGAGTPVFVKEDGTKVIPKGGYTVEVAYAGITGAAFAPAKYSAAFGSVAHNGTTIQVPYLTTFADYAQRLVLVNRGGADAAYSVTFTPEVGVTATAGTAATGTIPAGKTVIVPVTDVVTLAGKTRTAATINVVAVSTNIDAATTSVNLADKSTDTVKLQ